MGAQGPLSGARYALRQAQGPRWAQGPRRGALGDRRGIVGVEVLFVYLKWANSLQGSFFIFTFVAIYLDEDLTRKKDVHNHGK